MATPPRRIIRPPAPLRPGAGRKTPAQQQAESDIYRHLRQITGSATTIISTSASGGSGTTRKGEAVPAVDLTPLLQHLSALDTLTDAQQAQIADLFAQLAALGALADTMPRLLTGGEITPVAGTLGLHLAAGTLWNGTGAVSFAAQDITLEAADPTNARFDELVQDLTTGAFSALPGIPSAIPYPPDFDPDTQLDREPVLVAAGATTVGQPDVDVYHEGGAGEWTGTSSGSAWSVSTTTPHTGSQHLAVNGTSGAETLSAPAAVSSSAVAALTLWVNVTSWPFGRSLNLWFQQPGSLKRAGNVVSLRPGAYGLTDVTETYQQITVPLSAFSLTPGALLGGLKFNLAGSGAAIVAALDDIVLTGAAGTVPIIALVSTATSSVTGTVKTTADHADPVVYEKTEMDGLLAGKLTTTSSIPEAQVTGLIADLSALTAAASSANANANAAAANANTRLAKSANLSDVASASSARTNLGLGTAATKDTPASGNASATQVVLGSDTRLSTAVGTVTSVGLSLPTTFTVTNSPVTGAGTLTVAYAVQGANKFLCGPALGADAAPTFRIIAASDLPAATASALGAVQLAGDLTGTAASPALVAVGTAGTFGSATQYPVITVDANGRVTSVSLQSTAAGTTAPLATTTPAAETFGAAGAVGTSSSAARADHVHAVSTLPDASASAKGVSSLSVAPASATAPVAVGDNDPRLGAFGASGTSHKSGLVPDPGATAGATRFLREDGWSSLPSVAVTENLGSGSNYSMTTTYANSGLTFGTLASGSYQLRAVIDILMGAVANDDVYCQFYNSSDSTAIASTEHVCGIIPASKRGQLVIDKLVTLTGAKTITVQAKNATGARGAIVLPSSILTALTVATGSSTITVTTGIIYRLNGSGITGLADGATVSSWPDSSGNGHNATLLTGTPTYKTNLVNGYPGVRFDGASSMSLGNLSTLFTAGATLFVVATYTGSGSQCIYSTYTGADDAWYFASNGYGYFETFLSSRVNSYALMPNTGTNLFSTVVGGSSFEMWVNQVDKGSSATTNFSGGTAHIIGKSNSGTYKLTGDVLEIIAYNYAMSATDRTSVESSLRTKYNI